MYASDIKEHKERLVFQVSGKLWQRSLIMRDLQTGSLWSHLLGECMEGPLKGSSLTPIPAVVTSWKDWKKSHPETTVLSLKRSAKIFNTDVYRNPEAYLIGINYLKTVKAWPYDFLIKNPVHQDQLESEKIVVVFLDDSATGFIFKRKVGNELVDFLRKLKDGNLVSLDGTLWDPWQAKAISGPGKGKILERLHVIPSYRKAWLSFHPKSLIAQ